MGAELIKQFFIYS